jgi:L-lactate dehydrogenase complex protein LldG
VPRRYRRHGARSRRELVALFAERVADYRATVVHAQATDVAEAVAASARVPRLGVPPGLPRAWRPADVEIVEDHDELSARELDGLDGVVTGCTVAIAETGTIVLSGGEAEGRRALTLVPDLHVCIVREDQIVELVPQALERLDPRRPLTFVSGPSATSDIELDRIEGVHGPRTLVVVIIKEETP